MYDLKTESYIERIYSKDHLSSTIKDTVMDINWDIIDYSTSKYAKQLQEYDISEIVKTFIGRYGKSKTFHVLPKSGNIDLSDDILGFHDFYAFLEETKKEHGSMLKAPIEKFVELQDKCKNIVDYLLTGKHEDSGKVFQGWNYAINQARRYKRHVLLGILSIDLPMPIVRKGGKKYACAGTQHYVAFAFDTRSKELFLFDSASKDPIKDETELIYMLRFTFEKAFGEIKMVSMRYSYILQPGAGDKSEEDQNSYNNQNVFCHTWSLWFSLIFICFYDTPKRNDALVFLNKLAHRNPLLNLAMIKRFAGWVTLFIWEQDDNIEFPATKISRARTEASKQKIMKEYLLSINPFVGLNYIYNYKTKRYIYIETLCKRRQVKMDIDLLDSLEKININAFIEKSKEIKCADGWVLNQVTKRCKKAPKA